jgi:hypothetical protein
VEASNQIDKEILAAFDALREERDRLEITRVAWEDYKKVCVRAGWPGRTLGGINRWTQDRLAKADALAEAVREACSELSFKGTDGETRIAKTWLPVFEALATYRADV